jgi:hypothetical protein
MTLVKILKDFINCIENENNNGNDNDEKSQICRLNYILDEYYQNKYDADADSDPDPDLDPDPDPDPDPDSDSDSDPDSDADSDTKTECCGLNNNNNIVNSLIYDIVNDLRNNIDIERNIVHLPELCDLKSYSNNIIDIWVELDKKENIEHQLVFNACKLNYEDEYIIYLLQVGFVPSILDTFLLAHFERFELLQYYFNKKLDFHKYTSNEIICQGRLDILHWLFQNDLVKDEYEQDLIETAIKYNDIFIVEYLMKYYEIEYIYNIYENLSDEFSKNKINNVMLAWLWGNRMKWTKEDSVKFNNRFMMSFFN